MYNVRMSARVTGGAGYERKDFMNRIRETFREGSPFRMLLMSILITGLSYGLYKGVLDN